MKVCLGYLQLDLIRNLFNTPGFWSDGPLTPKKCKDLEFLHLEATNWYYNFQSACSSCQSSVTKDVLLFLESEHSVTWLVSHFAFAGLDLYQGRSHHIVEALKHWSNTPPASEPGNRPRRNLITIWRSAFVQLSREWDLMLCQAPMEIYHITSSLFKEERAKVLLKRTTDVCTIDNLGSRPTDDQFQIDEGRYPILHLTSNVLFTCGPNDIDCRSGDTGFIACRLKYSVAIPNIESGSPLRVVFRPNDMQLLIALEAKNKQKPTERSKSVHVLSATICPDSLP